MAKERRAKGEGTFDQLPSGLWSCYVRKEGRKIRGEAAATKQAAAANLRDRLANLNDAGPVRGQSFTIFAQGWLNKRSRRYSPTTIETYTYWIASLARDPIGHKDISKITSRDLKAWRDRQDMANETLRKRCSWVNQLMAECGSDARVDVPPKKEHLRRPLSPSEREVLMKRIEGSHPSIVLAAFLCWHCGLRRSEACGLRHEDRDGDGFWVRRVVLVTKGTLTVRDKAKSAKGHGWVPLPPALRDAIGSGKGYILGDDPGTPMNPKSLTWHFNKLIEGTALEEVPYMGAHTLRRTYGMTLLEIGADVVTAAKAMRHDPKMLLDEYARTRHDLMIGAVETAFGSGRQTGGQNTNKPHHTPHEGAFQVQTA